MKHYQKRVSLFLVLFVVAMLLVGCAEGSTEASLSVSTDVTEQKLPSTSDLTSQATQASSQSESSEPTLTVTVEPHSTPLREEELIASVMPILEANEAFYAIECARIYNVAENPTNNDKISHYYDLALTVKTRFTSTEELPHVQGLLAGSGFDSLDTCRKAAESNDDVQRRNLAKKILKFVEAVALPKGEFEMTYALGAQTDENGAITESFGVGEEDITFSIENYLPESAEEMYQRGIAQAKEYMG